jgi:hypothetical protein
VIGGKANFPREGAQNSIMEEVRGKSLAPGSRETYCSNFGFGCTRKASASASAKGKESNYRGQQGEPCSKSKGKAAKS